MWTDDKEPTQNSYFLTPRLWNRYPGFLFIFFVMAAKEGEHSEWSEGGFYGASVPLAVQEQRCVIQAA